MRRVAICAAVFGLVLALSGLRLRQATGEIHLSEALQKSAYARVAKAWSAPPDQLAAGWGLAHLPLPKLTAPDATKRSATEGLPPRLSVLVLGQRDQPQVVLITAEVLSIPSRLAKLLKAYAGEVLALPTERIVVIATHTHAGPRPHFGPLMRGAFGQPEMDEKDIANAVSYAADRARQSYQRVTFGEASSRLSGYVANRSPGVSSPIDDRLRAVTLNAKGRQLLIWSYAAHPTLVSRQSPTADGDYPARVANILEEQAGLNQVVFLPGRTAHATMATERHPGRVAEVLAHALRGLVAIAQNNAQPRAGLNLQTIELPMLKPRIALAEPVVLAPWLNKRLGSNDVSVQLLRLGSVGFTLVSGEVSNGLVPSQNGKQWVVSLAGSGLGYLVAPKDRSLNPERPLVLLNDEELTKMGELLRIVSASAKSP